MRKAILRTALLLVLLAGLAVSAHAEDATKTAGAPRITVHFSNAETGSRNAAPGIIHEIQTEVVYEGSEKGKTYTLNLQLTDSASGVVCALPDGSNVIRQTFTAEDSAGVFEFEFVLNSGKFQGRTLTEVHYIQELEATYSDLNREEAGRIYVPAIETTAVSEKGEKTVYAGKNTVICDVISYSGLAPNEEYRVVTELLDSATGKQICDENGKPVTATSRFTPTEADGKIAVKAAANLRSFGEGEITVAEEIFLVQSGGNYLPILSSKNSEEEDRTVSVRLARICVLDALYGVPVPGVGLTVSSVEDGFSCEAVTDENGECCFPLGADEVGQCTVTSVPDRYYEPEGSFDFTVAKDGGEIALSLEIQKKNIIKLKRTDAGTGQPVEDIVTEVRDAEGNGLVTVSYNEEGVVFFDANDYWDAAALAAEQAGLDRFALTFSFRDISTPAAYYPRETGWTVSIDENRIITGPEEIRSVQRKPIFLQVVNAKGDGIAGVTVMVYDMEGNAQGQAVSDHDGGIYFTPQKTGEYLFAENTLTFEGAKAQEQGRFAVDENGEISGSLTITGNSWEFLNEKTVAIVAVAVVLNIWIGVRLVIRIKKRKKAASHDAND